MPTRARLAMVLALLVPAAAAPCWAQAYDNDVRLRGGVFSPQDLPTPSGLMYGIEIRNLLTNRDGIVWGVARYHEKTDDRRPFGVGGTVDLRADIEITPFYAGWLHFYPSRLANFQFGAAGGLYVTKAFSGGVSGTSQVKDFGKYRFLQDSTYFGVHFFGGIDFFPESPFGIGIEARLHFVENSFGGGELSAGAIYRF